MSLFSYIKQKFFYRKQQSPSVDLTLLPLVPNPFIPWEVYPDIDPDVCLFTQGNESTWLCEIWFPYWESLSEREKEDLKSRAPTDAWREWLDWRSEGARIARIDHEERGIPFDCYGYLYDFKVNYIIDYLQDKKITK
ncbi:hypothetical protein [uncultured Desulfovibrio sp.]|uniref:hypothetical protein n=1 Tax=uncultured Desulfovibrio sp. TaxID=167968 RepID=UPI0025EDF72E|nr:hypothetical protein [uncultured Desulfovibrio sp.]